MDHRVGEFLCCARQCNDATGRRPSRRHACTRGWCPEGVKSLKRKKNTWKNMLACFGLSRNPRGFQQDIVICWWEHMNRGGCPPPDVQADMVDTARMYPRETFEILVKRMWGVCKSVAIDAVQVLMLMVIDDLNLDTWSAATLDRLTDVIQCRTSPWPRALADGLEQALTRDSQEGTRRVVSAMAAKTVQTSCKRAIHD